MGSKRKFARVFDGIKPIAIRPCSGWKDLGSEVFEHSSGIRIHVGGGLVRLPSGKRYWLNSAVGETMGWTLIKINGGNKKRGLMTWAINCIPWEKQ